MSKMKKVIMIVAIVLVSCAIVVMSSTVKATDENPIIDISGNLDISTDTNTTQNTESNTDVTPSINTTAENSQVIQPVTNTTENTSEKLPQTGVTEDITVMFFIVVCAVSAIYAYKKIKDYNM